METNSENERLETAGDQPNRKVWKIVISVGLILHLWAVIAEPLRFATRGPFGTSPATSALHSPVRLYSEFTYLNHGYAFFAPQVGPSHLVFAQWKDDAGKERSLLFPDRQEQWPRLLYHRYFMLSEFLNNNHQPARLPTDFDRNSPLFADWRRGRSQYEAVRDSFARKISPSGEVTIQRIEHGMVDPVDFINGVHLQHDSLYRTLPDGLPQVEEPQR